MKSLGHRPSPWERFTAKIKRWWNNPVSYPWPEELNEEVSRADSQRICHRCMAPQDHDGWFCQECGAATGPYNNMMPFVYIFSIGEVFRNGVSGKKKPAVHVTAGYLFVSFFEYLLFFPLYWFRLFRNRKRLVRDAHEEVEKAVLSGKNEREL
ncbi:hypothetical protein [Pontiella sp.]|uniref:hypothetical protein n=1 Tax=Pontiella sp. TaxID=2837462 RepID=UPI003564E344